MPPPSPSLAAVLFLPLAFLLPGLVLTLTLTTRARATVGAVIAQQRPRRRLRVSILIGLHVAVLAFVFARPDIDLDPAIECLGLGILITWFAPGFNDAISGESGVQRGWYARRYEELEEWRLTGEHLRFRLSGEWTAVPLPAGEQPRIRELLTQVCPERESRFRD